MRRRSEVWYTYLLFVPRTFSVVSVYMYMHAVPRVPEAGERSLEFDKNFPGNNIITLQYFWEKPSEKKKKKTSLGNR